MAEVPSIINNLEELAFVVVNFPGAITDFQEDQKVEIRCGPFVSITISYLYYYVPRDANVRGRAFA